MTNFKDRIKQLRIEKNLSQNELAKIAGVTRSTISLYETGRSDASDEIKKVFAKYFNVSLDYISGYSDIREPHNIYAYEKSIFIKIPFCDASHIKDVQDYIFIESKYAQNGSYFFTKVPDDYMINARIAPGDLIYVRKQSIPCDGDIIVIIDDKTKLTLRRAVKAENSLLLISENPYKYSTFNTSDIRSGIIEIIGKVISVIFQV